MVYVDSANIRFKGQSYCHMATDGDVAELHAMAAKVGLRRSWFQSKSSLPHYDVAPSKRALAVQYGAVEVNCLELVRRCSATLKKIEQVKEAKDAEAAGGEA
jgi:hypothetical protein